MHLGVNVRTSNRAKKVNNRISNDISGDVDAYGAGGGVCIYGDISDNA